jgi:hypothetical protein
MIHAKIRRRDHYLEIWVKTLACGHALTSGRARSQCAFRCLCACCLPLLSLSLPDGLLLCRLDHIFLSSPVEDRSWPLWRPTRAQSHRLMRWGSDSINKAGFSQAATKEIHLKTVLTNREIQSIEKPVAEFLWPCQIRNRCTPWFEVMGSC